MQTFLQAHDVLRIRVRLFIDILEGKPPFRQNFGPQYYFFPHLFFTFWFKYCILFLLEIEIFYENTYVAQVIEIAFKCFVKFSLMLTKNIL